MVKVAPHPKYMAKVAPLPKGTTMESESESKPYNDNFGIAMPGGGIRAASFSSGVLFYFIHRASSGYDSSLDGPHVHASNSEESEPTLRLPPGIPKHISCVSGGGYVGSSFLYWSRVNKGQHPKKWAHKYFGHMRNNIGYYMNWSNPCIGLGDLILFLAVICFTLFMSGCILAGLSFVLICSVMFVNEGAILHWIVDERRLLVKVVTLVAIPLCFGLISHMLHMFAFSKLKTFFTTGKQGTLLIRILRCMSDTFSGAKAISTVVSGSLLLVVLAVESMEAFIGMQKSCSNVETNQVQTGANIFSGFNFGYLTLMDLTRILYFIIFIKFTWLIPGVIAAEIIVWSISMPEKQPFQGSFDSFSSWYGSFMPRSEFSFMEKNSIDLQEYKRWCGKDTETAGYNDDAYTNIQLYRNFIAFSAICFMMFPIITWLQQNIVHHYSMWRLVRAFYPSQQKSFFFSVLKEMLSCKSSDPRAFIKWSGDDDSLPNYISQTTAGQWVNLTKPENTNNLLPIVQSRLMERKFTSTVNARGQKTKEHAYDTMTLCSRTGRWDYMENHGMDSKPKEVLREVDRGGNGPNTTLDKAMQCSAAALARSGGDYGSLFSVIVRVTGLDMGSWVNTTKTDDKSRLFWAYNIILSLLWIIPTYWAFFGELIQDIPDFDLIQSLMTVAIISYTAVLTLGPLASLVSHNLWFYTPGATNMASFVNTIRWTEGVPTQMYLHDGGHSENTGLLGMLARRVPHIIVSHAGPNWVGGIVDLTDVMKEAEAKLSVTMSSVLEDQMRRGVVNRECTTCLPLHQDMQMFCANPHQRVMVIRAAYGQPSDLELCSGRTNSTSLIFFCKISEDRVDDAHLQILKASHCTTLDPNKFDRNSAAAGNCCVCCNRGKLQSCWKKTGNFPYHSTGMQLFTTDHFDSYHAAGFAAAAAACSIDLGTDSFMSNQKLPKKVSASTDIV